MSHRSFDSVTSSIGHPRCRGSLAAVFIICLAFFFPLRSIAQPIPHHHNVPKDPDAAAALFVSQFKTIIPYYDARYHLTIIDASQNKANHTVRLNARLNADQIIRPEKEYYIPLFTGPDMPWDITLLADNGYDLCVLVRSDLTANSYYGSGGLMVILTNDDLVRAVGIDASKRGSVAALDSTNQLNDADLSVMGHDYLVNYANRVSALLPLHMGEGENFVQCYFRDTLLTMTLEYDDSVWPGISQFLRNNLDDVRVSRAQTIVEDTSNAVAISALVSQSSIRHIYRNRSHTDSVDFIVTPWMLDYVYNKTMSEEENVHSTPSDYLLALAQQLDRQAPIQVDEMTRLVKCTYDTVSRLMTYIYTISDAQMLQFEGDSQLVEVMRERMLLYFKSDDPEVKALVDRLIAADATVSYTYRSPHGRQPMVFTFTAPEISHALQQ